MQAEPHFSWLREFAVPTFFTLFGAALGFVASQLRDSWKAKRDKEAFLRAVGMELDALGNQLDSSLDEVMSSTDRVKGGGITGPQFAGALRTAVFTSQVAKLRDVDDPLLIEVIHYYSDLGTLQHILEMVNDDSAEFTRANIPSGDKETLRPRLLSGLRVLQEQIFAYGKRRRELRAKLPPADKRED